MFSLHGDHWLEGFQCLHGVLEAEGPRRCVMLCRCLSHDRANEIVREHMRPDLFTHQFRSFAAQHVHLQSLFQATQIEFDLPIIIPPQLTTYHASIAVV